MKLDYDKSEPNGPAVMGSILLTGLVLGAIFISGIYLYKTFITIEANAYIESPTKSWATQYREKEDKEFKSYKWVNKTAGKVQIPVNDIINSYK